MAYNYTEGNYTSVNVYSRPLKFMDAETSIGCLPSVNLGYGPYLSKDAAETAIANCFGGLQNVPDGVQAAVYSKDESGIDILNLYIWYNNHLQVIASSGGNGGNSSNVQAQYVVGSTNWNITIPTNANGQCTQTTLTKVSKTTITIENGNLNDFEFSNNYVRSIDGDNLYEIVVDKKEGKLITFHYKFLNGTTTPTSGTVIFSLTYMGVVSDFYQYITVDPADWVYTIFPSSGSLSISSTGMSSVTVDVDAVSADNSDVTKTLSITDLEVYYYDSQTGTRHNITGTFSNSILTINESSVIAGYESYSTIGQVVNANAGFRTGEQIIIRIKDSNEWQFITIIRSTDIVGIFNSPYSFELSRDNLTLPSSFKDNSEVANALKNRTLTKFFFRGEDGVEEGAYLLSISFTGIEPGDITIHLVYEDNTVEKYEGTVGANVIGCYISKISEDGSIDYVILKKDDPNIFGTRSQSISFVEGGESAQGYYLNIFPQIIGKQLLGSDYVATDAPTIEVRHYNGEEDTVVTDWSNVVITRSDGKTINSTTDNLTDYNGNLLDVSTITYSLKVSDVDWGSESIYLYLDTFVYDYDLNNDTIIIDSQSSNAVIEEVSTSKPVLIDLGNEVSDITCEATLSSTISEYLNLSSSNNVYKAGVYLARTSAYPETTRIPSCAGYITYTFRKNGAIVKTARQTVKVLDITNGHSYKLIINPNTYILNSDKTATTEGTTTIKPSIYYVVYDGDKPLTKSASFNPTDPVYVQCYIRDVNTLIKDNGYNLPYIPVSYLTSELKLTFLLIVNNGTKVMVDSETIGYTTVGPQGDSAYSIQMSNDSVVIDDDSKTNVVSNVTLNYVLLYNGSNTVNESINISITSTLSNYFLLQYKTEDSSWTTALSSFTVTSPVYTRLTLKSGTALVPTYGYITYKSDSDPNLYKVQTIRVANISDGNAYNLIVYPNVILMSSDNTYETSAFNVKLCEISEDGTTDVTPGSNDNYLFKVGLVNSTSRYTITAGTLAFSSYPYTGFKKGTNILIEAYKKSSTILGHVYTHYNTYKGYSEKYRDYKVELIGLGIYGYLAKVGSRYSNTIDGYLPVFSNSESEINKIVDNGGFISSMYNSVETIPDVKETCYIPYGSASGIVIGLLEATGGTLRNAVLGIYTVDPDTEYLYNLIDTETLGFAKQGLNGSGSGYSISLDNDSFMIDDDTKNGGLAKSTVVNATVFNNGTAVSSPSFDTSVKQYGVDGTLISNQLQWSSANNCIQRVSTYTNKLTEGYGYVLFDYKVDGIIQVSKKASFIIKDFSGGETYNLAVTPNSIFMDSTGNVEQTVLTATVSKFDSDGYNSDVEILRPNNSIIKGSLVLEVTTPINNTYRSDVSVSSITFDANNILKYTAAKYSFGTNTNPYVFNLYYYIDSSNRILVDSESVDFAKLGLTGAASTTPGCTIRYRGEYDSNTRYLYNENDGSGDGLLYIDVVRYNGNYYKTISSRSVEDNITPEDDNYTTQWSKAEEYDLLIANEILVKDDNGNITGGMIGGDSKHSTNGIVLWAGANASTDKDSNDVITSADKASFKVDDSGNVYAERFDCCSDGTDEISMSKGELVIKQDASNYIKFGKLSSSLFGFLLVVDGIEYTLDLENLINLSKGNFKAIGLTWTKISSLANTIDYNSYKGTSSTNVTLYETSDSNAPYKIKGESTASSITGYYLKPVSNYIGRIQIDNMSNCYVNGDYYTIPFVKIVSGKITNIYYYYVVPTYQWDSTNKKFKILTYTVHSYPSGTAGTNAKLIQIDRSQSVGYSELDISNTLIVFKPNIGKVSTYLDAIDANKSSILYREFLPNNTDGSFIL